METVEICKVRRSDVKLGEPLPYSVYDKSGVLLLRAGFVITLERHLDSLIENGLYIRREPDSAGRASVPRNRSRAYNTFVEVDLVKQRLQQLFEHYKMGKGHDEFVSRINSLSFSVQEACIHDVDSALANLHLDYETSYAVVHHLQAAILCELIAKKLEIGDDARQSLINAALTYDLGLLDIQDILDRQGAPLNPEQKARIATHPHDGVRMLQRLGVTDPVWLDAVGHHHERLDGSGYPDQLIGDSIPIPTRILAVADTYSAMVRDRPYRKAMVSKQAMRHLLLEQGNKTDHRLIELLIKESGVFPPGTLVKLVNGEIGVVKQRQENGAYPTVYAFIRANGMPMLSPMKRETMVPQYHIDGMVRFANYGGCLTMIRNLWLHR